MKLKKGVRALSLLLVMALLGGMFIPAVSAEDSLNLIERKILIEDNYIPIETALEHATLYMWEYTSQNMDENAWNGASIDKEPIQIYDTNGKLLFYLFSVEINTKTVGSIITPASKVLGFPVQSIGEPYTYDIENSLNNLNEILSIEYKDFKLIFSELVCYDYPKLGILVKLLNTETKLEKTLIFDAFEMSNKTIDIKDNSWSYYQQISNDQLIKNIECWNLNSKNLEESSSYLKNSGILSYNEAIAGSKAIGESDYISSFPTVSQGNSEWCMIATAWLITKHYYYSTTRSQTDIANHMNVYTNTGPTWTNYLSYYTDSYSDGGLGKTDSEYHNYFYQQLEYDNIKTEIKANRPISVGASGHERACIGYWQYTNGNKLYKFSDPDPQKTTYWEAADSEGFIMNYNDFTLVK